VVVEPAPRESPLPIPVAADDRDRERAGLVVVLPERDEAAVPREPRTMGMARFSENLADGKLQAMVPLLDRVRDGQLLAVRSEIGAGVVHVLEDLAGSASRHLDASEGSESPTGFRLQDRQLVRPGDREDVASKIELRVFGAPDLGPVETQGFAGPPRAVDDRLAVRRETRVGDRALPKGQPREARRLERRCEPRPGQPGGHGGRGH
jgi:hypothetical protein